MVALFLPAAFFSGHATDVAPPGWLGRLASPPSTPPDREQVGSEIMCSRSRGNSHPEGSTSWS